MKIIHCKDLMLCLNDYQLTQGGARLIAETTWQGQQLKASFVYYKGEDQPMALWLRHGKEGDPILLDIPKRFWSTPIQVVMVSYAHLVWS